MKNQKWSKDCGNMNLNNFNIIKKTIFIIFSIMIIYQNRLDDKYILKISRKFNI